MKTQVDATQESQSRAVADARSAGRTGPKPLQRFEDKRPEAQAQARLQAIADVRPVVQRNKESQELLTKLATPQVFPGPEVEVQDKIVLSLETLLAKEVQPKEAYLYNVTCVGGIVLPDEVGNLGDLIDGSELIELPDASIKTSTFDMAKRAGVDKLIVINTLATMEQAGQLEYLRKSGLIDKDWIVVVEIHYYRDRDKSQTKLHKDTAGQTLFVNLNFTNDEEIAGPEFIVNPETNQEYAELVRSNLPPVFGEDLAKASEYYGEPQEIGMSRIPKKGVVSFVDEAIHHKTPTLGHRTVSSGGIKMALKRKYGDEYDDAQKAYNDYSSRSFMYGLYSYSSYMKSAKDLDAETWYAILSKLDGSGAKFDRTQLAGFLPKHVLDIDELIEEAEQADFGRASFLYASKKIPRDKWEHVPVKKPGRPPLKRQMSEALLRGDAPKPTPGKRRFFRTWVRAVPRK